MKEKIKVLSYIFRENKGIKEVLVFTHRDVDAGVQVAGGTVDPGEELVEAITRELFEEAGLKSNSEDCHFLGETIYFRQDIVEKNIRHYFEIKLTNLPNTWSHIVESHGLDNQLVFDFFWLPLGEAKKFLVGNMQELL